MFLDARVLIAQQSGKIQLGGGATRDTTVERTKSGALGKRYRDERWGDRPCSISGLVI